MSQKMRSSCERCGNVLADDGAALARGFGRTLCEGHAVEVDHVRPNRDGEFVARPRRQMEAA